MEWVIEVNTEKRAWGNCRPDSKNQALFTPLYTQKNLHSWFSLSYCKTNMLKGVCAGLFCCLLVPMALYWCDGFPDFPEDPWSFCFTDIQCRRTAGTLALYHSQLLLAKAGKGCRILSLVPEDPVCWGHSSELPPNDFTQRKHLLGGELALNHPLATGSCRQPHWIGLSSKEHNYGSFYFLLLEWDEQFTFIKGTLFKCCQ